jgi:hypothetical protein
MVIVIFVAGMLLSAGSAPLLTKAASFDLPGSGAFNTRESVWNSVSGVDPVAGFRLSFAAAEPALYPSAHRTPPLISNGPRSR